MVGVGGNTLLDKRECLHGLSGVTLQSTICIQTGYCTVMDTVVRMHDKLNYGADYREPNPSPSVDADMDC